LIVQDNLGLGITVLTSSVMTVNNSAVTIQRNAMQGLQLNDSGTVQVNGATMTIQQNGSNGISVSGGAHVVSQGTGLALQINNNGTTANISGVQVFENASVRFGLGTVIRNNAGRGLQLFSNAQGNLTNIMVQNNGAVGVDASDASLQLTNSTISGNGGSDIA